MLEVEQSLCFTVAGLLLKVFPRSLSPVVPNNGARRKGNPFACLLQPPTNIDIVACPAELRIETIDLFERPAAKGHIAAGDVFRLLIAFQDMRGLARARSDACRQGTVLRRQVWAAYSCS